MASADDTLEIDDLAQGEDDRDNKRRLMAVLALIALIFILLWLYLSQAPRVPDVVGMKLSEAEATIVEAGFVVGDIIETLKAEGVRPGEVAAQAPAGGARALKGAQIDLTVAAGGNLDEDSGGDDELDGDTSNDFSSSPTDTPDMGDGSSGGAIEYGPQVPQVLGMTESKAISTLRAAGYNPVIAGRGPSTTTVAAGLVYYQDPPPEAFEPRGKTIEIWISTGTLTHGVPYPQPE